MHHRTLISIAMLSLGSAAAVVVACSSTNVEDPANGDDVDSAAPRPTSTGTTPLPPAGDAAADAGPPEPTIRISAHAGRSTCAAKGDRTVLCWGSNDAFGLGRQIDGGANRDPVPTAIPGYLASNVSAGFRTHCGLDQGKVACWGFSLDCNLNGIATGADGGPDASPSGPVSVALTGVDEVVATERGACARVGADVKCWGNGTSGIHGSFDAGGACSPPAGNALTGATALASTSSAACALRVDGTVWCWGFDRGYGEFGRRIDAGPDASGVSGGVTPGPVQIAGISGVKSLGVGYVHACVVKGDSTVWCWGLNGAEGLKPGGQLGHVGTGFICRGYPCDTDPKPVPGLTGVREVSAGTFHTCAVKSDDTVVCWGESNFRGLLGRNPNDDRDAAADAAVTGSVAVPTPLSVKGLSNVAHISAGWYHTCAVTRDDKVYCWGTNTEGQLGPKAILDGGALGSSYEAVEVPMP